MNEAMLCKVDSAIEICLALIFPSGISFKSKSHSHRIAFSTVIVYQKRIKIEIRNESEKKSKKKIPYIDCNWMLNYLQVEHWNRCTSATAAAWKNQQQKSDWPVISHCVFVIRTLSNAEFRLCRLRSLYDRDLKITEKKNYSILKLSESNKRKINGEASVQNGLCQRELTCFHHMCASGNQILDLSANQLAIVQ